MVVQTSQPDYKHHSFDEYWKIANWENGHLTRAEMKNRLGRHNYKVPGSANRTRLCQALSRSSRGLISYDCCNLKELKTFCAHRGVQVPYERGSTKLQLMQVLETADEQIEFIRFMDLPPELRVYIYTLYFSSLPEIEQPVQPPVTKVSRITRDESLPIFYQTCTFIVNPKRSVPLPDEWWMNRKGNFFYATSEKYIGLVRNLWIDIFVNDYEAVLWDQGNVTFWCRDSAMMNYTYYECNKPSRLGQQLARYLEHIRGKAPGRSLRRADIGALEQQIWNYRRRG